MTASGKGMRERQNGDYAAPILAEPDGGPIPQWTPDEDPTEAAASRAHQLVDGLCTTCSPTALRAGHFDPNEPRDPHSGKWSGGPGGAAANITGDLLDLAGRIQLGDGEHLHSSGRLETHSGHDVDVLHAVIDTPSGRQVRLGIIPSHDAHRWTAADKGATSVLSPRQTAHLRDDLADATKTAKAAAKKADAAWARGDTPDTSTSVASGVTHGDWADLHWSVDLTDDDPTSWSLSIEPAHSGKVDESAGPATLTPKDVGALIKQLDGIS